MIIAHAHVHAHEAAARDIAGEKRAKRSGYAPHIHIQQPVFDIERLVHAGKLQTSARALQLVAHGLKRFVVVSGRDGSRLRRRSLRPWLRGSQRHSERHKQQQGQHRNFFHCASPFASESCPGGGRIGGRSVDVSFFCTSISEIRIAGATAETGTEPDSAPQ